MKVRILGCSGGIGGRHLRTTSLLLDHDVLIDAGTGVGDLSIAELTQIDHVFLTHSHLDHVACLPFIVDTVGEMRNKPLRVHGTDATLQALRRHIFNWTLWPDFTVIPDETRPSLILEPIAVGTKVQVAGRKISALPANHTVPAVGYRLDSGDGSLVFTGDTTTCPALWQAVNRIRNLRYLLIETAFSDREERLATMSKHLCPRMLAEELQQLRQPADIFITHLKPGQSEQTMRELEDALGHLKPRMLQSNQVFEL